MAKFRFGFIVFGIALLWAGLFGLVPLPGKYGNPSVCYMDIFYGATLIILGITIPLVAKAWK